MGDMTFLRNAIKVSSPARPHAPTLSMSVKPHTILRLQAFRSFYVVQLSLTYLRNAIKVSSVEMALVYFRPLPVVLPYYSNQAASRTLSLGYIGSRHKKDWTQCVPLAEQIPLSNTSPCSTSSPARPHAPTLSMSVKPHTILRLQAFRSFYVVQFSLCLHLQITCLTRSVAMCHIVCICTSRSLRNSVTSAWWRTCTLYLMQAQAGHRLAWLACGSACLPFRPLFVPSRDMNV